MGCCFSTNFKPASAPSPNDRRLSDVRSDIPCQAKSTAPPLPPEEESVKEVLSETPVPKPQIPKIELPEDNKRVTWPAIEKVVPNPKQTIAPSPAEETSEMSDLCSVSESISAMSTATATEEGEVRKRSPANFRNRPVAGQRNAVGKSPMRRSTQPSPGRVQTGLRDRQRKDLGEISGRRSRSPATRVADGGVGGRKPGLSRSPSSRKTGKSPGRARSDPEKCLKQEEPANSEDKWPPMPPTVKESLENPLVSLECFIFL